MALEPIETVCKDRITNGVDARCSSVQTKKWRRHKYPLKRCAKNRIIDSAEASKTRVQNNKYGRCERPLGQSSKIELRVVPAPNELLCVTGGILYLPFVLLFDVSFCWHRIHRSSTYYFTCFANISTGKKVRVCISDQISNNSKLNT